MLIAETQDLILRLTLNRPEVRNAFNDELIATLTEAFTNLPAGTRAVVVDANGPAFCAGGDLEWMRKASHYSEAENIADALKLSQLFHSIAHCPAVVIVKVQGAAFGGGAGLVAAADIAIAMPESKFAFSEVKLGLIPATISPYVVPKIGPGNARALFATGEVFDAERALRIGLIQEIASEAEIDSAIQKKLQAILAAGPSAVILAKQLVLDPPQNSLEAASRLAHARASAEGREGVSAFLEKRKASFYREINS